jgi:hypothetical protein
MMDNGKRKPRRQLSPEEKWEVFLEVASQEISQADAARKYGVDVSVIVRLRALAKDAAIVLTDTLDGDDDAFVDGDRGDERPNDQRVGSGNGWQ